MEILRKSKIEKFKETIIKQSRLKLEKEKEIKYKIKKPHIKVVLLALSIILIVFVLELFSLIDLSLFNFSNLKKITEPIVIILDISLFIILCLIIYLIFKPKKAANLQKKEIREERTNEILEKESQFKIELKRLLNKLIELSSKYPNKKKAKDISSKIKKILESKIKDYNKIRSVLKLVDNLFVKLPKEEIEDFAYSNEAEIYENLMKKYKLK